MMCIIVYGRMGQSVKIDVKTRWITTIPNDFKKKVNANKETQRNEFECREKCEQQQKKQKITFIELHLTVVPSCRAPRVSISFNGLTINNSTNGKTQVTGQQASTKNTNPARRLRGKQSEQHNSNQKAFLFVNVNESHAQRSHIEPFPERETEKNKQTHYIYIEIGKTGWVLAVLYSRSMCFESPVQYAPYANPSDVKSYSEKSYWLPSFRENIK